MKHIAHGTLSKKCALNKIIATNKIIARKIIQAQYKCKTIANGQSMLVIKLLQKLVARHKIFATNALMSHY